MYYLVNSKSPTGIDTNVLQGPRVLSDITYFLFVREITGAALKDEVIEVVPWFGADGKPLRKEDIFYEMKPMGELVDHLLR